MGPPARLWGVQLGCFGLLRPLLRPVPHLVAGAAKVCNLVRVACFLQPYLTS